MNSLSVSCFSWITSFSKKKLSEYGPSWEKDTQWPQLRSNDFAGMKYKYSSELRQYHIVSVKQFVMLSVKCMWCRYQSFSSLVQFLCRELNPVRKQVRIIFTCSFHWEILMPEKKVCFCRKIWRLLLEDRNCHVCHKIKFAVVHLCQKQQKDQQMKQTVYCGSLLNLKFTRIHDM